MNTHELKKWTAECSNNFMPSLNSHLGCRAREHLLNRGNPGRNFLFGLFEKGLFGNTDLLNLAIRKRDFRQSRIRRRRRRRWRRRDVVRNSRDVDRAFWRSRSRKLEFCSDVLVMIRFRCRRVAELGQVVVERAGIRTGGRHVDPRRWWRWNDEA